MGEGWLGPFDAFYSVYCCLCAARVPCRVAFVSLASSPFVSRPCLRGAFAFGAFACAVLAFGPLRLEHQFLSVLPLTKVESPRTSSNKTGTLPTKESVLSFVFKDKVFWAKLTRAILFGASCFPRAFGSVLFPVLLLGYMMAFDLLPALPTD